VTGWPQLATRWKLHHTYFDSPVPILIQHDGSVTQLSTALSWRKTIAPTRLVVPSKEWDCTPSLTYLRFSSLSFYSSARFGFFFFRILLFPIFFLMTRPIIYNSTEPTFQGDPDARPLSWMKSALAVRVHEMSLRMRFSALPAIVLKEFISE
jgi:hypothetical protein